MALLEMSRCGEHSEDFFLSRVLLLTLAGTSLHILFHGALSPSPKATGPDGKVVVPFFYPLEIPDDCFSTTALKVLQVGSGH